MKIFFFLGVIFEIFIISKIGILFLNSNSNEKFQIFFLLFVVNTAGAVRIATISKKRAGTKIEISPLRYMIETSGFFSLYTHLQQQYQ
jgi:hypothetical protein